MNNPTRHDYEGIGPDPSGEATGIWLYWCETDGFTTSNCSCHSGEKFWFSDWDAAVVEHHRRRNPDSPAPVPQQPELLTAKQIRACTEAKPWAIGETAAEAQRAQDTEWYRVEIKGYKEYADEMSEQAKVANERAANLATALETVLTARAGKPVRDAIIASRAALAQDADPS